MEPLEVRGTIKQSRRIDGWFARGAAGLFGLLDYVQQQNDVRGDLFEVGVHHGKSAVFLGRMARPSETLGICDVFANQNINISGSGSGQREIFERNMRSIAPEAKVRIYEKLSSVLTTEELGGPYRFFHVDGGHLAEEALSDLRLGASVLDQRGLLIVDDAFSPQWPGVTEAIFVFISEFPEFQPVALGFNKLVLTRGDTRSIYDTELVARATSYFDRTLYIQKKLPIFGSQAVIFFTPSDRQMPRIQTILVRIGWLISGVRRRVLKK